MSNKLREGVSKMMPNLNPLIANGLAESQLTLMEEYIDSVWKAASETWPDSIKYLGSKVLNPNQEFAEHTRKQRSRENIELARSDFYLVSYMFQYLDNDPIIRYIYLPCPKAAIHIRGRQFYISPVLADPAFSPGKNSIFVQLTSMRLTFERLAHHYLADGKRENVNVVWSWIHSEARTRHRSKGTNPRVPVSSLLNYFLAKYGVKETFFKYVGAKVELGDSKTINASTHPSDKWVICQSLGVKPRGWMPRRAQYTSSDLRVAVPRSQYNDLVSNFVGTLFYIIDNFPKDISVEDIDDAFTWKVILTYVIYGRNVNIGLMVNELESHLESIERYMDFIVVNRLRKAGLDVKTVHDLFMEAIKYLTVNVVITDEAISTMYPKQLVTLRYVAFSLVNRIFRLGYALEANFKKAYPNLPDNKAILNLFNRGIAKEDILKYLPGPAHPEVAPISSSTDNKYLGYTANMMPQESVSASRGKVKMNLSDPANHLHVSVAEVASYSAVSKADPTGRSLVNPCVLIDADGTIRRNLDFKERLDYIQELLRK